MTPTDIRYDLAAAIRSIPMPDHMAARPVSEKGFPVPYFVAWLTNEGKLAREGDGRPDFRVVDRTKARRCLDLDLCWLCGRPLGKWRALVVSPMCLLTGTSPDPDSHTDCSEYAVRACPFLTHPRAARNARGLPEGSTFNANGLKRNPGVSAIVVHWQRRLLRIPQTDRLPLFRIPEDPRRVTFWAEGRRANRPEVLESIESGLAPVRALAEAESPDAVAAFNWRYQACIRLVEAWTDDFEAREGHENDRAAAVSGQPGGRGAVA